jgi:hypothetical protein
MIASSETELAAARAKEDGAYLLTVAKVVRDALRRAKNAALIPRPKLRAVASYTDGHFVVVADLATHGAGRFELWLDRYTGPGERRLQYCFSAPDERRIRRIADASVPALSEPLHRSRRHWGSTAAGMLHLRMPLPPDEYGTPILEIYGKGSHSLFYGVYIARPPRRKPLSAAQVRRITRFATTVATAVYESGAELARSTQYAEEAEAAVKGAQGISVTPAVRRALEVYGMQRARAYLKEHYPGYHVEDVHANRPYDYQCSRGSKRVYVEVKCTTTAGAGVFLTKNEVRWARQHRLRMALLLVHGVRVGGLPSAPSVNGGTVAFRHPWEVHTNDLEAIAYRYTPPHHSGRVRRGK